MLKVRQRRRLCRLVSSSLLLAGFVLGAPDAALGDDSQLVGSGGGNINGTLNLTQVANMCAEYSSIQYDSGPGYAGTYTAPNGTAALISEMHYSINETTYQNLAGSHGASNCSDPAGAVFTNVSGWAALNGTTVCTYTSGAYRRLAGTIEVELKGTCTVGGNQYAVHQKHVNEQVFVPPAPRNSEGTETFETCPPVPDPSTDVCTMT